MRTNPPSLPGLSMACLLLAAAVGLSACSRDATPGGKEDASTQAASAAGAPTVDDGSVAPIDASAAPAPELGAFRVAAVLLGDTLDGEQVVRADQRVFDARDAIHASVLSTGVHPGLTLTARWRGPGGAMILETAQAIAPTTASVDPPAGLATTFSLRGKTPWPTGDYRFELLADGHLLQAQAFSVR